MIGFGRISPAVLDGKPEGKLVEYLSVGNPRNS